MTALNYSAGTVSLTAGSAVVTGIDTAWATALLKGGEIFVQAPGNPLPIATIDSDTQITAALKWTGATGVYDYVLRIGTAYDQQIAKNAEILARLLAEIEAGTVWKYDASGNTAGRDFYDNRAKDFSYLDISGEQPILWVKASNDPGDWAGPFSYGVGPVGPAPSLTFSPVVTGEPGTPASVVVTGGDPKKLAFTIPAGLTGIRWRGVYSAGTSYLERDGIRDNGSTWIALQDTLGNAPPVLPVTSNAFWELVAAKGTDGSGTGDVVGPAGVIDGRVALFDGTTGKLLKQGPALGAAATQNVGTTAGTVAAGDDPRFSAGGRNEAILALEIADLKGPRLGMVGGVADAFDDETGVASATNAVYDAVNDWYMPSTTSSSAGQDPVSGAAASGSNITLIDRSFSLLSGKTVVRIGVFRSAATALVIKILEEISSTSFSVMASQSISHPGGGLVWFTLSSPFVVPASGTFRLGYYNASGVATSGLVSAARAWRSGDAAGANQTGFTADTGGIVPLRYEYDVTHANMAITSVSYPASAAPALGRIALQLVETDVIAINTHVIAKISRDGGAAWATATLALSQSLVGPKMYEATGISLSSLPSGASMKWKIETANNKNVAIAGVVMQWS